MLLQRLAEAEQRDVVPAERLGDKGGVVERDEIVRMGPQEAPVQRLGRREILRFLKRHRLGEQGVATSQGGGDRLMQGLVRVTAGSGHRIEGIDREGRWRRSNEKTCTRQKPGARTFLIGCCSETRSYDPLMPVQVPVPLLLNAEVDDRARVATSLSQLAGIDAKPLALRIVFAVGLV